MANALDRLQGINANYMKPVSLDEQLDDMNTEDDDFLNSMSDDSKQALLSKIKPGYDLDLDDDLGDDDFLSDSSMDEEDDPNEDSMNDNNYQEKEPYEEPQEEVVEEPKPRRGRPAKPAKQKTVMEQPNMKNNNVNSTPKVVNNLIDYDAFIKSLSLDFIDELDASDYVFKNFTKQQMTIMLNYMRLCINK